MRTQVEKPLNCDGKTRLDEISLDVPFNTGQQGCLCAVRRAFGGPQFRIAFSVTNHRTAGGCYEIFTLSTLIINLRIFTYHLNRIGNTEVKWWNINVCVRGFLSNQILAYFSAYLKSKRKTLVMDIYIPIYP